MNKLIMLISLIFLSSCSKTEQTHTVSEYFKNPELMNATNKNCHDNYGSIGATPNCQNAAKAKRQFILMNGDCLLKASSHKVTYQQCAEDYYNKWVKP